MQLSTHTSRTLQRIRTRHIAAVGGLVAATALAVVIAVTPAGPRSETAPAAVAVPPSMPALYEEAGGGALSVNAAFTVDELTFAAAWFQPAPDKGEAGGTTTVPMDEGEFLRLWYQPYP